jgi:3-oxoacyl-[acyl-carrier-protein] synthase II
MMNDEDLREVVITGLGVVSPIGIGRDAFNASLRAGRSGIRPIKLFDASGVPVRFAGEVTDFDPKLYVRPRKSLKVMAREIQFGFAAADMALQDANLDPAREDPDRFGVVFGAEMIYCELNELESVYRKCISGEPSPPAVEGIVGGPFQFSRWAEAAMGEIYPLWLLRNLPNMVACHIAIAHDARGPNNTIGHSDVSSLNAIIEGVRVIQRDAADVMIVGGVGARVNPTSQSYRGHGDLSHRNDEPARACRPFDADRDGLVNGEGAAAFILESRQHAEKRGAPILARIQGYSSTHEPVLPDKPLAGSAARRALTDSLSRAGLQPSDISHVNAHGLSTIDDDHYEAQAIHEVLGDVPVTAAKSFFGHLGAGCGAVELVAALTALQIGEIPFTLNYEHPDPACPVDVVVGEPRRPLDGLIRRAVVKLSTSRLGYAAALVIGPN